MTNIGIFPWGDCGKYFVDGLCIATGDAKISNGGVK